MPPRIDDEARLRHVLDCADTATRYHRVMESPRFVYWQDGAHWLGFLEEFPDYLTQGDSLEDLQAHLRDLHADLTSGQIPAVRRTAVLDVA